MIAIAEIQFSVPTVMVEKVRKDDRGELLNTLYATYRNELDIKNQKRYYAYVRLHHKPALTKKEEYYSYKDEFRTAKLSETTKYLNPIKKESYVWWGRFSHLKGEDGKDSLRVMISDTKDILNRKGNVISYILGASGKLSTN